MKSSVAFLSAIAIVFMVLHVSAGAGLAVDGNPRACGGGCVTSNQCAEWDGGNRDCRCSWFSCKGVRDVRDGEAAEEQTRLELFEQFINDYKDQPAMVLAAQEALHA